MRNSTVVAAFVACPQANSRSSLVAALSLAWLCAAVGAVAFVDPATQAGSGRETPASKSEEGDGSTVAPDGVDPLSLPGAAAFDAAPVRSRLDSLDLFDRWSLFPGAHITLGTGGDIASGGPFDALLGRPRPSRREASLYRFSYTEEAFQLTGNVADAGRRLSGGRSSDDGGAGEEAKLVEQHPGKRGVDMAGEWRLAPGVSLSTTQVRRRTDDPLDERYGLTTTRAQHGLVLGTGRAGVLKAALNLHREEWAPWTGKQGEEKCERQMELATTFGSSGGSELRLATGALDSRTGPETEHESTSEARLRLAPVRGLRLTADYESKGREGEDDESVGSVGAALNVGPGTELSATLKRLASGTGETREEGISLTTKLVGGSLDAEEKIARENDGTVRSRRYSFAGGFGGGAVQTNLKIGLTETRGDRPGAKVDRDASFHLDRSLGPRLKLTLEHRHKADGTDAELAEEVETRCEVSAGLGRGASVTVEVAEGNDSCAGSLGRRRLALSRDWEWLRLRFGHSSRGEGDERESVLTYCADLPAGELPAWAKDISSAHQFSDAHEYLISKEPVWGRPDMPFSGYRVWAARRSGGEDDGQDTLGAAYRRVIGARHHLLLAFETGPEGTSGSLKGRPLSLRRQVLEIGTHLPRGLNLRCGYGLDTSSESSADRVARFGIGAWGKLGEGGQAEIGASRTSGGWDGTEQDRTSVSVLYSRDVGDEHRIEFKAGYAWSVDVGGGRDRERRFAFGYETPL